VTDLSASEVMMIHKEALYQVYIPLLGHVAKVSHRTPGNCWCDG